MRTLFIGGSVNQTSQMRAIAAALPECESRFTPYYCDGIADVLRRAGFLEASILGKRLRGRCLDYLEQHRLAVDLEGHEGRYDLVVTCSDLVVPRNVQGRRLVVVQEGMMDPPRFAHAMLARSPLLRPLAGTAATGLSGWHHRLCVASEGYRALFVERGVSPDRIVVTGIPNFDDCRRWLAHQVPLRGYVLVCTSDIRETYGRDDRAAFLGRTLEIAAGRPLVIKLHPNERVERATEEVRRRCPRAVVVTGAAEPWIAHCDVLVTQRSSLTFVGLALDKEVHTSLDVAALRRLVPDQHGRAAHKIADVCREVLSIAPRSTSDARPNGNLTPAPAQEETA